MVESGPVDCKQILPCLDDSLNFKHDYFWPWQVPSIVILQKKLTVTVIHALGSEINWKYKKHIFDLTSLPVQYHYKNVT